MNATIENACLTARAVFVPYFGQDKIDDICAVIRGDKIAAAPQQQAALVEPPMPIAVAVKLTGLTPQCLHYHARKGRIHKALIPGSKRALGFVAADIRAIVQGHN